MAAGLGTEIKDSRPITRSCTLGSVREAQARAVVSIPVHSQRCLEEERREWPSVINANKLLFGFGDG